MKFIKKIALFFLAVCLLVQYMPCEAQMIVSFGNPDGTLRSLPYSSTFKFGNKSHTDGFGVDKEQDVTVTLSNVTMNNRSAKITVDVRIKGSGKNWYSVKKTTFIATKSPTTKTINFIAKPKQRYQVVIYKTEYKSINCKGSIDIR